VAEDVEIRVGVDDRASAVLKRVAATTEAIDKAAKEAGKGDDKAYVAAQKKAALLEDSARAQLFALKLNEGASREQRLKVALVRSELELASKLAQIKAAALPKYQEELEIQRAKLAAIKAQERLQADDKAAAGRESQGKTDAFNADEMAKRTKGTQQLAMATGVLTVGIGAAAAASAILISALDTSYTKARAAAEVYLDYKRALDQVEDSLYRTGAAEEDATKRLGELNAETAKLARMSNFDQPELLKSLSKIIDLSGQAEHAQKGLGLAVAISTKRGQDLDEVSEKVAQAMKGEIAALEDLTPLTGQQADALRKIEDDGQRAVKAIALLEAQYGGLLEGQDRTYLAMRSLKVAQDELVGSFGEVVTESGALAVVLEPVTRIIDRLTAYVQDNKTELKLWLLEGIDRGVELVQRFTTALKDNADIIAGGVTIIRLGAGALGIYLNVLQIISKAVITFSTLLISGVVKGMSAVVAAGAELSGFLSDDLAASLHLASDGLDGVSERFAEISAGAAMSAAEDVGDITKQFEDMGKAISQTDLIESKLRQGLQIIGDEADTTRKEIAKLKAEVDKPTSKKRPPAPPKPPKVAPDDTAKRAAEAAARLRLQALDTQDKEIKAALEYQAKLKEIEGQKLKGAQGELARRQAALDAERALDDVLNDRARTQAILLRLETAGREARSKDDKARVIEIEHQAALVELKREDLTLEERALKLRELEAERTLALRELEAEAIDEQAASWERVASNVGAAAQGADGYGKVVGEGLSALVGGFGQIDKIAKQSQAGILSAAEASSQGIEAAGGAITSFAGALGASAAEQAGILALFETASAFASFAVGDVFGGGQHLLAAGLYTAVAASSGGGGAPSASGASAGGGAAGGSGTSQAREQRSDEASQRRGARVIAEEIAGALGKSTQPITVIYDQRGSIMADSPAGQRRLYEATAAGGRQVGADLNDLKRNRRVP
jgi:hypothetical protein